MGVYLILLCLDYITVDLRCALAQEHAIMSIALLVLVSEEAYSSSTRNVET